MILYLLGSLLQAKFPSKASYVYDHIQHQTAVMVHRCLYSVAPEYLSELLVLFTSCGADSTGHALHFYIWLSTGGHRE